MVLPTIYRSLVTRLVAVFIIVLVVSPYTEPFATLVGTDFAGAGAVDVTASKSKMSEKDVLHVPLILAVVISDAPVSTDRPLLPALTIDSRHGQRAILRL